MFRTVKLPRNSDWNTLATLGVIKGEDLSYLQDRDGFFCYAEVPEDWTIQQSNHWMVSSLKDGKGEEIAEIRINSREVGYQIGAFLRVNHSYSVLVEMQAQERRLQLETQKQEKQSRNFWIGLMQVLQGFA